MKPGQDQKGVDVWDFILDPSDELIKRYHLKVNTKGDMLYTCQLPYELVIQLNADPSWNRWIYLRTYDGELTAEMRKLEGTTQQEEIMRLKNQLAILKMKLDASEERVNLMQLNMPKYLERNFKPMLEQIAPILEKMSKKNE